MFCVNLFLSTFLDDVTLDVNLFKITFKTSIRKYKYSKEV